MPLKMRYMLAYENEFNEDLFDRLCKKDMDCFWKAWKKKFYSRDFKYTDCINGKFGKENVLAEFSAHFQSTSKPNTFSTDASYRKKVDEYIQKNSEVVVKCPRVDITLIADTISEMKLRKAGGHDGLQNEHVTHAGPNMVVHLSLLFSTFLRHSCVPDDFCFGVIKPMLKSKHGDFTKVDMFRGITLTLVISRLFEAVLLSLYGKYLYSDCLQFGFKKNSGCYDAIFTFIESQIFYSEE